MRLQFGVCDDMSEERIKLSGICKQYLDKHGMEYEEVLFSSGEEVLDYCSDATHNRIDLLFLDIEMDGISGIELKDELIRSDRIWRIAYVSSHTESVFDAYGTKTIGFVPKPIASDRIEKMLDITIGELRENVTITVHGIDNENLKINLDDILYMKANGSYTEIYTNSRRNSIQKYALSCKKLGVIEQEFIKYPIVRVHKSYMVNVQNVVDFGVNIVLDHTGEKIPVGRAYKETAKKKYYEYGKNRMRKRL